MCVLLGFSGRKMSCAFRVIDPPVHRLVQIPSIFRQVFAQLKDGTVVCPLALDKGETKLTLSGNLLTGCTGERHVVHQHLKPWAGRPTAQVLQWAEFEGKIAPLLLCRSTPWRYHQQSCWPRQYH